MQFPYKTLDFQWERVPWKNLPQTMTSSVVSEVPLGHCFRGNKFSWICAFSRNFRTFDGNIFDGKCFQGNCFRRYQQWHMRWSLRPYFRNCHYQKNGTSKEVHRLLAEKNTSSENWEYPLRRDLLTGYCGPQLGLSTPEYQISAGVETWNIQTCISRKPQFFRNVQKFQTKIDQSSNIIIQLESPLLMEDNAESCMSLSISVFDKQWFRRTFPRRTLTCPSALMDYGAPPQRRGSLGRAAVASEVFCDGRGPLLSCAPPPLFLNYLAFH